MHTRILFIYMLDDSERTLLRDMTLREFLGAAAEFPKPVYFDLNQMGCPFDLRVAYMQPHEKNVVEELETANPARQAFIDWLSSLKLRVSDNQLSQIFGQSFNVSVPCGSVDL